MNTVKDAINDLLMPAKISFFSLHCYDCCAFLENHFSPLESFLYQEPESVMRLLMQNFTDILTEVKSTFKLMKIDLQQVKCNRREAKIVTATSSLLTKIKVSESCKSQFHDDCLEFYIDRAKTK